MKLCHQFQPDFVDSFFREHSKKDVNKKFTYIIKVFFQSLVSSIFYMLYAYFFSQLQLFLQTCHLMTELTLKVKRFQEITLR